MARLVAIYEAVDNPFSKVRPALLEHVVVGPELDTAVRQKAIVIVVVSANRQPFDWNACASRASYARNDVTSPLNVGTKIEQFLGQYDVPGILDQIAVILGELEADFTFDIVNDMVIGQRNGGDKPIIL